MKTATILSPAGLRTGLVLAALLLLAGCSGSVDDRLAAQTCEAVEGERYTEALQLSETPFDVSSEAGRSGTECRCIAQLSLGDRAACAELLDTSLRREGADGWVVHPLLAKLILREWRNAGLIDEAARLVARVAPVHHTDLDLLQLEMILRSQVESEDTLLNEIEARLSSDLEWTAQRLVLALARSRRAEYTHAIRVLGEIPPPITHPLVLPWFESRIEAQAASNDLAAVQATFADWLGLGWDPVDLEARYALRVSVAQLRDPEASAVELIQRALEKQSQIRDRNVLWGLHRRLITDLLAEGRPQAALAAYDAAIEVVPITDIERVEIERAVDRVGSTVSVASESRLRFVLDPQFQGGVILLSPDAGEPPDAGYRSVPIDSKGPIEITTRVGSHPRRWILRDPAGAVRASGAVWPTPGELVDVRPVPSQPLSPTARASTTLRPADGRRRVIAILPDCADWRITEYLRARGELPFFDRLFTEGHYAVLESRPAFTAAALQSLVWPGRAAHPGSLGWIHRLGLELGGLESVGRNPVEWLSLVLPERPNLFEILGQGELTTANMLLAHGQIDAGRHAEIIGPHGGHRRLPSQSAYRSLTTDERTRFPALESDADTRKHIETIAAEMDAAEEIVRAGEVDFLFLRLEALDLITHAHFGSLDGRGQDDAAGPLAASYRYIDERLATLHERLDADDWLVVLSDHGIRSSMEHEEDAIFAILGQDVPRGRAPGKPSLRGVPRALAAMLSVETDWPDSGAAPWLAVEDVASKMAARP